LGRRPDFGRSKASAVVTKAGPSFRDTLSGRNLAERRKSMRLGF